jgi:anti-sigma factor ChrR (cupin superfamily)
VQKEAVERADDDARMRAVPPDVVWNNVIGNGFERPDLPWKPWSEYGREGVDICPLFTTAQTGPDGAAALLVRFRPGAHGDFHKHMGFELMLVLDGVLEDDKGGYYPAGTLALEGPGSIHQALSRQGCTVLAVRERPAVGYAEQPFDATMRS